MPQWRQVLDSLEELGGVATLLQLYRQTIPAKTAQWKTKTPEATIRRIVQENPEVFHKIKPGLYCVQRRAAELDARYKLPQQGEIPPNIAKYTHSHYQGLLVEIGSLKKYKTFVPSQDKNRLFLGKPLVDICDWTTLPQSGSHNFGYPCLMRQAKTVDVIWFNERQMPNTMFEIELSTDMNRSLIKFNELQDFYTQFKIVAPEWRVKEFQDKKDLTSFREIRNRVKFVSFEEVEKSHSAEANCWRD